MTKSSLLTSVMHQPLSWPGVRRSFRLGQSPLNIIAAVSIFGFLAVSAVGLLSGDMFLCLEPLFLAFVPYVIWSSYRRAGALDIFAPDLGFPLAYIVYLTAGSVALPIETQFGLVLPWVIWIYYIIGLVAYLAGVRLLSAPSRFIAQNGGAKRFWPAKQFLIVTLGLFAVGALCRAAIVAQSGLEIFHAADDAARVTGAKGLLAVLSLCLDASFECILIFLLVRKPKGILCIALIGCLVLIGLDAVATTNRTALLRVMLAGVVVVHYTLKRFKFGTFLIIGLLTGAFASALGTFRDVSQWGDQHIQKLERQGFTRRTYWLLNGYEALRLPTETFYMTVQHFPELDSYTYGKTSLAEFGAFLPGPTLEPSRVIKEKLRLEFVGFGAAATILAPLWADGGVIGIIIGMFLIGMTTRVLHQRVLLSPDYLWILLYGWYMQNALKAIKDDIIPDLSFLFVLAIFPVVAAISSTDLTCRRSSLTWRSGSA